MHVLKMHGYRQNSCSSGIVNSGGQLGRVGVEITFPALLGVARMTGRELRELAAFGGFIGGVHSRLCIGTAVGRSGYMRSSSGSPGLMDALARPKYLRVLFLC